MRNEGNNDFPTYRAHTVCEWQYCWDKERSESDRYSSWAHHTSKMWRKKEKKKCSNLSISPLIAIQWERVVSRTTDDVIKFTTLPQ